MFILPISSISFYSQGGPPPLYCPPPRRRARAPHPLKEPDYTQGDFLPSAPATPQPVPTRKARSFSSGPAATRPFFKNRNASFSCFGSFSRQEGPQEHQRLWNTSVQCIPVGDPALSDERKETRCVRKCSETPFAGTTGGRTGTRMKVTRRRVTAVSRLCAAMTRQVVGSLRLPSDSTGC